MGCLVGLQGCVGGQVPQRILRMCLALAAMVGPAWSQGVYSRQGGVQRNPRYQFLGMTPTPEQELAHSRVWDRLPLATGPDGGVPEGRGTVDLLDYLAYDPKGWEQCNCRNCLVWAGTAALSIQFGTRGLKVPLSVQFFNSKFMNGDGACCGGYLETFVSFYNQLGMVVPWGNENAGYVDSELDCGTGSPVRAEDISTQGALPFVQVVHSRVPTFIPHTTRRSAISLIKSQIENKVPVLLSFFLSEKGWSEFNVWWFSSPEHEPWLGFEANRGRATGHMVTLVGYDDADKSWILLNSWGTTPLRPNGLFRIPQDLAYASPDTAERRLEFDVLRVIPYNSAVTLTTDVARGTVPTGTSIHFRGACSTSNGRPLAFTWDFGDGTMETTSEGETVHAFINTTGSLHTYRVVLSIGAMASYRSPMEPMGKAFIDVEVEP